MPPSPKRKAVVPEARTHAEQVALLSEAITRSGLSIAEYARTVLVRDARTVQRWLSSEQPIPNAVLAFLQKGAAA